MSRQIIGSGCRMASVMSGCRFRTRDDRASSKRANKQTSKQANEQTSKQANEQTSKHANKQT
eukprot:2571846-Rhodomonas_salina.1